jgi:hypothetical protein
MVYYLTYDKSIVTIQQDDFYFLFCKLITFNNDCRSGLNQLCAHCFLGLGFAAEISALKCLN